MFDVPIHRIMRKRMLLTARPGALVHKAAQRMAARNAGAIVVVEGECLAGIITERDIVFRVVAAGLDPRATPIADVMTRDPVATDPGRPLGYALALMHREGFRHLPVVKDGKVVGIISARSALDPDLEEFAAETRRRDYYARMR